MAEHGGATFFDDPDEWRAWLEQHHATETALWLGFWKKHTDHPGLAYEAAVEQALCFGWIDGVLNRIDDRCHKIRFTPRKKGSNWSQVNVDRVADLERRGLMTDAGRAAHAAGRTDGGDYGYRTTDDVDLAPEYVAQLAEEPAAREWFESRTASYQRSVRRWVMSAKQQATRDRRMAQLVEDSAAGRLVKPFRYGRNTDDG